MGANQSLPEQPDYNAVTVMSDSRKGKSGLFGFHGRSGKAKRDSNVEHILVHKDSMQTAETKEVLKGVGLASSEKEKKRFGFRAPVRCVSADGRETVEIRIVKPSGDKELGSGDGKKSRSFQPPGMETWKMIDDDNASARSRSSSREKTLESKSKRTKPQMTHSLPVNLNSSRLPSLMNRLTRSNTIDSRVSTSKRNKSEFNHTEVPKTDIAEASTQHQQKNAATGSSPSIGKPVPSFLRKPKSFLFGLRKSVPRSPLTSTPEKPEKPFVAIASEDCNDEVRAKEEKLTESSPLTEASPLKCQPNSENEPAMTSTDSGQGSSLDACHILTPKSHDSTLSKSRLASESDAPLAAIDFDDDCSIGSDDLMLDLDLGLDNDDTAVNDSHRSSVSGEVTKKRISISRFNSASFHYPDESTVASEPKVERRSSVIRRPRNSIERGSTQKSDRRLQARLSSASFDLRSLENSEKNALNELISLMEVNQLRNKPSRLASDSEVPSASGDGSVLVAGTRRQMSLKPPRQNSIIDDDGQMVIDAFTHRSMAQDLTSMKTMLLKLKRILQEDELQCPSFNQPTLNASSMVINKTRLSHDQALPVKGGEVNNSSPDTKPSYNELVEVNHELQSKVCMMQRTIDEQQKTISLLQQQMTKYECGMSDISEEEH